MGSQPVPATLTPEQVGGGLGPVSLKRWTLCLVRGHRWARIPYAGNDDGDVFFLRCLSCGYENHNAAMPGRPFSAG